MCQLTRAALSTTGDVAVILDGSTTPVFEIIIPSEFDFEAADAGDPQTTWERDRGIVVGVKLIQGGRMDINGATEVRYQDLIIGSRGLQNGVLRTGSGTVLITGDGALYSNDPTSFPPQIEAELPFTSTTPRATDEGFDVYVGQWGQGRLELHESGRAEIQDAVIVGDNPGSSGIVVVEGLGTLLGNGGFVADTLDDEAHQMIVGRQGTGQMYIIDGALVVSEGPQISDDSIAVGAVIGSDAFIDNEEPILGGTGEVTVSGLASRWIIGGSLQVGGFHNASQGIGLGSDVEGDDVVYNGNDGQAGRGTLIVETNAVVAVRAALTATPDPDDDLLLAIGRFGTVDLRGGLMVVGAGIGGTQSESTSDKVQVVNDGLIRGYGRIETGGFRNRYFGQVRVSEGESLIIDSTAEFVNEVQNQYPLINFGLIEVLGTADQPAELEFVRPPASLGNPLTPLINRPVATKVEDAPTTFDGGMISAQHARLRFTSGPTGTPNNTGMKNEGVMAFTAGTNIIAGHVVNQPNLDNADALDPKFLIGPNTTVVVEDDFTVDSAVIGPGPVVGGPIFDLGDGATLIVLDQSTLTLAGTINMDLSLSNPSRIEASGDIGLGGFLNVSLASDVLASLAHGSSFEILSFAGQAYGIDTSGDVATPNTTPIPQNLGVPLTVSIAPDLNLLFPNLDPIVQRINQGIFLSFLDPSSVGPIGATGADFDGDGDVDQADLAIWKANKGIVSGASVLQGDANGDGAVDGEDYLIWLEKFTSGGVPGGSPFVGPTGTVPEPTGFVLLSLAGMLALTFRTRRG
jgi:T5SS/PEP-CTERM-associated repeat protein